jgi:hypothetical protein
MTSILPKIQFAIELLFETTYKARIISSSAVTDNNFVVMHLW